MPGKKAAKPGPHAPRSPDEVREDEAEIGKNIPQEMIGLDTEDV